MKQTHDPLTAKANTTTNVDVTDVSLSDICRRLHEETTNGAITKKTIHRIWDVSDYLYTQLDHAKEVLLESEVTLSDLEKELQRMNEIVTSFTRLCDIVTNRIPSNCLSDIDPSGDYREKMYETQIETKSHEQSAKDLLRQLDERIYAKKENERLRLLTTGLKEGRNVFARRGMFYVIQYDGKHTILAQSVGTDILARLLSGETVSKDPPGWSPEVRQKVLADRSDANENLRQDRRTLRDLQRKIKVDSDCLDWFCQSRSTPTASEIGMGLAQSRSKGVEPETIDECPGLIRQYELLAGKIRKTENRAGRARPLAGDRAERERSRLSHAINNARTVIEQAGLPELAAHLKEHVKTEPLNEHRPHRGQSVWRYTGRLSWLTIL